MSTVDDAQQFTWMLDNFVRKTFGVTDAVAVSSDGLLMAASDTLKEAGKTGPSQPSSQPGSQPQPASPKEKPVPGSVKKPLPGEQKPHCDAPAAVKHSAHCRRTSPGRPSCVTTDFPATRVAVSPAFPASTARPPAPVRTPAG